MAHTTPHPRRGRRGRRVLIRLGASLLVVSLLVLLAIWQLGPRYGLYLVPPSPAAFADDALQKMDQGYYAQGPAWEAARAKAVRDTRDASSHADTLPALREAVAVAGGRHSKIFPAGESLSSVDKDRPLPTVTRTGPVTTITVPKVSAEDQGFQQRYAKTLTHGIAGADAATTCGWIVDARHNHGGDMRPMLAGLSPLLADGKIAGFVTRTGGTTDVTVAGGTIRVGGADAMSAESRPKSTKPVAVLQGPDNGSSGEVVVLAFKGAPGARSFGAPTAGYSSANQTVRLYDGTQMLLTTALDTDRHGKTYGGPIAPDQVAPVDTAHEAAQTWLQQRCR